MTLLHEAVALVRCVDSRYSRPDVKPVNHPNLYEFTCAGASLALIEDHDWRAGFYRQLQLLGEAGVPISLLCILDHWSANAGCGCKAYGPNDSFERHEANLINACRLLRMNRALDQIAIKLFLHDIDASQLQEVVTPITAMRSDWPDAEFHAPPLSERILTPCAVFSP